MKKPNITPGIWKYAIEKYDADCGPAYSHNIIIDRPYKRDECKETVAREVYKKSDGVAIASLPQLLEALEFYANPENWKEQETGIGMAPSGCEDDCGSKATAALIAAGYTK